MNTTILPQESHFLHVLTTVTKFRKIPCNTSLHSSAVITALHGLLVLLIPHHLTYQIFFLRTLLFG